MYYNILNHQKQVLKGGLKNIFKVTFSRFYIGAEYQKVVYRVPKGGLKVPKGGFKMPINGVKWRFLGLNEKRCKRTDYIYIYRKSHFLKSDQKPQGGRPSLKPTRNQR